MRYCSRTADKRFVYPIGTSPGDFEDLVSTTNSFLEEGTWAYTVFVIILPNIAGSITFFFFLASSVFILYGMIRHLYRDRLVPYKRKMLRKYGKHPEYRRRRKYRRKKTSKSALRKVVEVPVPAKKVGNHITQAQLRAIANYRRIASKALKKSFGLGAQTAAASSSVLDITSNSGIFPMRPLNPLDYSAKVSSLTSPSLRKVDRITGNSIEMFKQRTLPIPSIRKAMPVPHVMLPGADRTVVPVTHELGPRQRLAVPHQSEIILLNYHVTVSNSPEMAVPKDRVAVAVSNPPERVLRKDLVTLPLPFAEILGRKDLVVPNASEIVPHKGRVSFEVPESTKTPVAKPTSPSPDMLASQMKLAKLAVDWDMKYRKDDGAEAKTDLGRLVARRKILKDKWDSQKRMKHL